jgi:hypothetical protein
VTDTLGAPFAHGREAELYDWDHGRAVLKLYRPGFGRHGAEAAALTLLDGTGVAPRLLERVQVEGRDGLVLQRLDGTDMLAVLQRRPWRLAALARMLARTARRIHQLPAPPELPDLLGVLGDRIAAAELPGRPAGLRDADARRSPGRGPVVPRRPASRQRHRRW